MVLVNPKLSIMEKINLAPHTNCWSNLVKRFKNLYYLVRVVIAWSHKSGLKKVSNGLDPQVWSFESARRLRATSLVF